MSILPNENLDKALEEGRKALEGVLKKGLLKLPLNDLLTQTVTGLAAKYLGDVSKFRDVLEIIEGDIFEGAGINLENLDLSDTKDFIALAEKVGLDVPAEYVGYIDSAESIFNQLGISGSGGNSDSIKPINWLLNPAGMIK